MDSKKEFAELVERIKATVLSGSPQLCALLQFFFENMNRRLLAKEIEAEFFEIEPLSDRFDPAHTREEVSRLKTKLKRYARDARNERWECVLPQAKGRKGYQLEFISVSEEKLSPSEILWRPHLDTAEETIVISGSHLFFFDLGKKTILRYYDFNLNIPKSDDETVKAVKTAHPECGKLDLKPWHDVYLASGDVIAHEALLRWFHNHAGVLVERAVSRDILDKEAGRRTPILIGRPETNRFIENILKSRQAAHLRYRIHTTTGSVKIDRMTTDERQALSHFPVAGNGVVGPVIKSETVFGIVSRLPNPSGYGHLTMIVSDYYAMVIARIVEAMTDDRYALGLLEKMKWPLDERLPDSFEMMFSVTLSPGNLEGEGHPELLCWSPA